ncbi:MAG: glycosyltransferase family 1 protein [Chloroflexota bacterium]|nr:MAG: glycosyltransferase family 1 protein [Chloroflexota bacterium]
MRPMDSTLRVLMVTPRYLPFIGGVELHVREVSKRLARAGISITVLTTDCDGQLPSAEEIDGIHIRRVHAWPAHRDYYLAPGVYREVHRETWDILHCQSYHTLMAPIAMVAALRARIPYMVTFQSGGHSSRLRNAIRGMQHELLRPLLNRADRLIALSEFEAGFFSEKLRLPRERIVVIANGSNLPDPECQPEADPDHPLIVSVGRLERYKGHQRILTALPLIIEKFPGARLRIAGSGPYERKLHQIAKRLSIVERVEIGPVPLAERHTMADLLARASLVVFLSDYESYCIAAMEAAALRRPLLVADTSVLSEIAARGLARAIPLDSNPTQVATAVDEMLRNPPSPPALDLTTWDDCAAQLRALYEEIAQGRVPCAS